MPYAMLIQSAVPYNKNGSARRKHAGLASCRELYRADPSRDENTAIRHGMGKGAVTPLYKPMGVSVLIG